ncbi:MFS transporter [Bacillus sp. AGMB 02131]|uniref:MFS transporter n=1 Tax=Peribacillus faecalis TaxID=2772559 RepID=A0A927CZK6_9BACI|nr:MFS transporter [Peribacillus faecalis]MBD3109999.1 MFS transporter [Peribacillus faecalis]
MKKETIWTKDFLFISINSFFVFLIFYSLMTVLPFFVLDELHQPEESVGLVTSIFLLASVIIRPFAGNWLDTIGRRKILLLALITFLLSTGLYFIAHSYIVLLILRFFQGIGFGLATTATGAIAADLVPKSKKGEGIGYYGMFMSIAMVIGPYLGLLLIQQYSFTLLFIFCTIFALLSFVLALFTKLPVQNEQLDFNRSSAKLSFRELFESSAIPISITAGIFALSYSSISSYVSLYAEELGLQSIAGFFFIIIGLAVIISRPFTGKWFDLYGENKVIYPALIIFMIGMILLSFTDNAALYVVSAVIIGLGYGAAIPSFQTISVQYAPDHRRGAATATYFFFFDTGFGIGAFVNGIIQAKTSFQFMFFLSGMIMIGTILIYYFIHDKRKNLQTI